MNRNIRFNCFIIAFLLVSLLRSQLYAQTLLVSPSDPYMGKIPIGSKTMRIVSIYNLGTKSLSITSISLANNTQFKLLNNPGSKTLGLLETFNLEIEYTPTNTGLLETEMTIADNSAGSPHKFKISGYGSGGVKPTFERIFGGSEGDGVGSVQQTQDGGYLLGGSTTLPSNEYSDFYLVKTNSNGETQWTFSYGGEFSEGINKAELNSDGSFTVFGSKQKLLNATSDLYFAKLNADKTLAWEKTFGGNEQEDPGTFITLSNGDYLLLGSSRSFTTSTQIYLLRVNKDGNIIWEKNYGGSNGENGRKVIPTKDGNFVIVGTTSSKGNGNYDVYLIKIDSNGNLIWDKTYGGAEWDEGTDIAEFPDGSFAVVGFTVSYGVNGNDMYLLKIDASGNQVWQKTFGGIYQDYGSKIVVVNDGIVISGTLQIQIPPQSNSDILLVKTDLNGNEVWRFQTGGTQNESPGAMIVNGDGNFVIAGSTDSYSNKNDAYFLCINTSGKITSVNKIEQDKLPTDMTLFPNYPNPFNGQTIISYQLKEQTAIELSVFNVLGEKVEVLRNGVMPAGNHTVSFSSLRLSSGIYFCVLKANSKMAVNKMILLK